MSFTFGFGGDDIENEGDSDDLAQQVEDCTINDTVLIPPRTHTLRDTLRSLPSQISYNVLTISRHPGSDHATLGTQHDPAESDIIVPRRSIFDIRAQLMAEANVEENDNDNLLAGLENGDLTSGIYEGGFKTWECALDLASLVANLSTDQDIRVIELGAGSAIPSLVLLQTALNRSPGDRGSLTFSLCDYNEDVLKLATAANILLVSELNRQNKEKQPDGYDLEIDDIDEEKLEATMQYLHDRHVSFDFVSGAWGDEFLQMIQPASKTSPTSTPATLILASETVYSPKSIKVFTSCLMRLLRQDTANSKAWIAMKKVYFGVGGGADAFTSEVVKQQGTVKTLVDIEGAGVGRVVLEITAM